MSEDIHTELERIAARLTALINQVDSIANDLLSIKMAAQQQAENLSQPENSPGKGIKDHKTIN